MLFQQDTRVLKLIRVLVNLESDFELLSNLRTNFIIWFYSMEAFEAVGWGYGKGDRALRSCKKVKIKLLIYI